LSNSVFQINFCLHFEFQIRASTEIFCIKIRSYTKKILLVDLRVKIKRKQFQKVSELLSVAIVVWEIHPGVRFEKCGQNLWKFCTDFGQNLYKNLSTYFGHTCWPLCMCPSVSAKNLDHLWRRKFEIKQRSQSLFLFAKWQRNRWLEVKMFLKGFWGQNAIQRVGLRFFAENKRFQSCDC